MSVRVRFSRRQDSDEEYVDVLFEGVPGVRSDIQSGVQFERNEDANWTLTFYAKNTTFATRRAVVAWIAAMHGMGFSLFNEDDQEINVVVQHPRGDDDEPGHWGIPVCYCVRHFATLEEGKIWVEDNVPFLLREAEIG
jgi:hypothetical protein